MSLSPGHYINDVLEHPTGQLGDSVRDLSTKCLGKTLNAMIRIPRGVITTRFRPLSLILPLPHRVERSGHDLIIDLGNAAYCQIYKEDVII